MVSRFRKHLVFVIGLLLLVVFGSGILLGMNMAKSESTLTERFLQDAELNTESYLVEQSLFESFENASCLFTQRRLDELSAELAHIGQILTEPNAEDNLGKVTYNTLKRKYHLGEMKTYLLYYQFNQQCGPETDVVLYYYGRNESDSALQGSILDQVVSNYQIRVFAIEYNYSSEQNFLEQYYNITSTPAMVINFDTTVNGLTNYSTITTLIHHVP